jgi:hypothetical protein
VLVRSVVLLSLNNSLQNKLVKILSLSETMELGMPFNQTMTSKITWATYFAVNG